MGPLSYRRSVVDWNVVMRRIPVLKCGWGGLFGYVIRQWMDDTMFILKRPHQLRVPLGAGCFPRRQGGRNLEIHLHLLRRLIMSAAQNGLFRKHYYNHPEDSLMMAPMECRNIWEKFIFNPYPTAFPYGNGMVLHFYQQQESSTTKTVHKVINKGLKTYV